MGLFLEPTSSTTALNPPLTPVPPVEDVAPTDGDDELDLVLRDGTGGWRLDALGGQIEFESAETTKINGGGTIDAIRFFTGTSHDEVVDI